MRLIIVVEGKTEEEFVNEIIRPYFQSIGFYDITAIKIQTSKGFKGGFVNYQHLKRDIMRLLHESNTLVTTFVDYFRIPNNLPDFENCMKFSQASERIICLEASIKSDIGYEGRFIPYIQQHEFESLLFTNSKSYSIYYDNNVVFAIERIIVQYDNPEDINDSPTTAPSKRLLSIISNYKKVTDGNLIALETGIEQIMIRCPRFRAWIELLQEYCVGNG